MCSDFVSCVRCSSLPYFHTSFVIFIVRARVGAKTRDILIQFLTESAILSACGGVIGILIGVGLVSGIGMVFGIGAVIRPSVVILAVSFSAAVGVFFGLYPASKAAKADPIDALRYE